MNQPRPKRDDSNGLLALPQLAQFPGVPSTPDANYGRAIRIGGCLLLAGFCGFFTWAAFAPLDEGVPAPGYVAVESKRKRIDHLNGGIVDKIIVREGETVREGQELIVLDETQAKAGLNAVQSQWRVAAATEARLQAEQLGLREIVFPSQLAATAGEPEVAATIGAQMNLFRSRREALEGDLRIIRESVLGLEEQVRRLEQLRLRRERQVEIFEEQLASYQKLYSKGFIARYQLLDLERQLAEVQSKQSEDLANIAGVNARLAEFRARGAQRETEYRAEVETQLTEVQGEVATLAERLIAQRDLHSRLVLRAPVAGAVVDLAFHTVGGVVKPGDRIMDIVPDLDELIVEARVAPQYIDRVRAGFPAEIHFDAYMSSVDRPMIVGQVAVVSADALTDERSGSSYYAMRVSVPATELTKLGSLKLQPGMQVTVMVKTGERSLLVYLTRPLLRGFTGALSER